MLHAERLTVAVALFDIRLQLYLFQVCLLQLYLLNVSLFVGRQAGKVRPLIAQLQHFAHLLKKLRLRIIAPPAPAIAKFGKMLLPTLDENEPSARDTVVRTLLPFRHEEKPRPQWIGVVDNKRAPMIRATKMNATPERLFVDFLFVDNRTQIDSDERGKFNQAN